MFFFVAGVQPKIRTLDNAPGQCPRCGLHQVLSRRVDHYLSVFFIPLIRVKQGTPFLYCQKCRRPVGNGEADKVPGPDRPVAICTQCGGRLEAHFKFCPHCGRRR